jgi:hypothetical protein
MSPEPGQPHTPETREPVFCAKHRAPLECGKIELTYQGHTFPVDTLCCPICGEPFIPEALAKGKMAEVEHTLEEK